jgi:hypothetical protein
MRRRLAGPNRFDRSGCLAAFWGREEAGGKDLRFYFEREVRR